MDDDIATPIQCIVAGFCDLFSSRFLCCRACPTPPSLVLISDYLLAWSVTCAAFWSLVFARLRALLIVPFFFPCSTHGLLLSFLSVPVEIAFLLHRHQRAHSSRILGLPALYSQQSLR